MFSVVMIQVTISEVVLEVGGGAILHVDVLHLLVDSIEPLNMLWP